MFLKPRCILNPGLYGIYYSYVAPIGVRIWADIASKHDGQDDGDGIGANVRAALQIKGHLPQRVGKYHCKFHQYWNVASQHIL